MNEIATFGAGCFWGVEETFRQVPGVIDTAVGYSNGHTVNPTYKDVCTDETGHAEVVQVTFDPAKVSFEELLNVFWKAHDPTQVNRQGPDFGAQYRTAIFFHSPEQEAAAKKSMAAAECQRKIQASHCHGNYRRGPVLSRRRIPPEISAKTRRAILSFLMSLALCLPARPQATRAVKLRRGISEPMETNPEPIKEILEELFSLLESLETQSLALTQFLKDQGIATDEKLAPYLDRAGNASSVKWRAARARMQYLLSPVPKTDDQEKEQRKRKRKTKAKENHPGKKISRSEKPLHKNNRRKTVNRTEANPRFRTRSKDTVENTQRKYQRTIKSPRGQSPRRKTTPKKSDTRQKSKRKG